MILRTAFQVATPNTRIPRNIDLKMMTVEKIVFSMVKLACFCMSLANARADLDFLFASAVGVVF